MVNLTKRILLAALHWRLQSQFGLGKEVKSLLYMCIGTIAGLAGVEILQNSAIVRHQALL